MKMPKKIIKGLKGSKMMTDFLQTITMDSNMLETYIHTYITIQVNQIRITKICSSNKDISGRGRSYLLKKIFPADSFTWMDIAGLERIASFSIFQ